MLIPDPKRLRHHTPILPARQDVATEKARLDARYDEATALGESEAGYSAAQRLLDEAVDAAVRPMPVWKEQAPRQVDPPNEHELKLSNGDSLTVKLSYGTTWWACLCVGSHITAASIETARQDAVTKIIDEMERALADLRFYQEHMAGKPTNGQPSVTAATSAALVEDYAGNTEGQRSADSVTE